VLDHFARELSPDALGTKLGAAYRTLAASERNRV
jgi:hypothetical protein